MSRSEEYSAYSKFAELSGTGGRNAMYRISGGDSAKLSPKHRIRILASHSLFSEVFETYCFLWSMYQSSDFNNISDGQFKTWLKLFQAYITMLGPALDRLCSTDKTIVTYEAYKLNDDNVHEYAT